VTPLAPFAAERYLIELRDRNADAPEGSISEVAYLWACGVLDVRADCLLIPVLATEADSPLLPSLERRNVECGWGLPPNYFRDRLEYGGCLLLIDGAPEVAAQYPRCPSRDSGLGVREVSEP
jgi:hypothetical protein